MSSCFLKKLGDKSPAKLHRLHALYITCSCTPFVLHPYQHCFCYVESCSLIQSVLNTEDKLSYSKTLYPVTVHIQTTTCW